MQPYVVLFVGALLAIMLLLSAIMGGDGADTHPFRWVGYHVERLLFGLLGYGAFLLPLMMVYLSVRCIRDGKDEQSGGLTALATGIVVLLPAVIHACMIEVGRADGALNTLSLKQLYLLGADKQGGGVVAGLLGTLLERGLGVIATLIIGIVLLLVAAALLFGITPAKIKFWWCAWSEARQERLDREAYEREQAEKEQRRLAASTGRRKQALPQNKDDDDTMMLLPGPSRARSQRENERRRAEALREGDKTNSNKLSPLLDVDLLVIDDIGAEPQFKNVTCEYLYLVISERARYHKKTIITTNLKPLEFIDRYGERIYSRIFDKSKSILLNLKGEDLRTDNSN